MMPDWHEQSAHADAPRDRRRLIVGLSGASGAIYGIRLLQSLAAISEIETHLVISEGARNTIEYETPHSPAEVASLANVTYDERRLGEAIASGTFITEGMIVCPCSISTLSAIGTQRCDTLLTRAADVCLKERRKLVLVVRETPLHLGHLRLMCNVTELGGVILPPVPGFYTLPRSIDEIIDHTIMKVLDQFSLDAGQVTRWAGISRPDVSP
jgi:4-hydroxy-3-polyprenylbenzoate decarboxylase